MAVASDHCHARLVGRTAPVNRAALNLVTLRYITASAVVNREPEPSPDPGDSIERIDDT
jgi:hypothetical protein